MMQRLHNLWENLSTRKGRWTVRAVLTLGLATLLGLPATYPFAMGGWLGFNILAALVCVGWGVFHPRAVLGVTQTAMRWAFATTLLFALGFYGSFDDAMAQSGLPRLPSGVVALTTLILIPFMFGGLVLAGWSCAVIGVFLHRNKPDVNDAARLYTHAGWIASSIGFGLLLLFTPDEKSTAHMLLNNLIVGYNCSFVLYTIWTARLLRWLTQGQDAPFRRFCAFLTRLLVYRVRNRRLDLRGASWGVLAAALVLFADATQILAPIQSSALATLLRVRGSLSPRLEARSEQAKTQTVLIDMDMPIRRLATTERSEADVQAQIIQKLRSYGVTRIVLPVPTLTTDAPSRFEAIGGLPNKAEVDRTKRDLPRLARAVREAGNVTLALRPETPNTPRTLLNSLRSAAREVTDSYLPVYGTAHIVSIPARWQKEPPAPVLLFAAAKGQPPTLQTIPGRNDAERIADTTIPLFDRKSIIPDFGSLEEDLLITRLSYSEVLRQEPISVESVSARDITLQTQAGRRQSGLSIQRTPPREVKSAWMPPAEFFKNKIVFLDSLVREKQDTYLGTLSNTEIVARSTDALLSGRLVYRFDAFYLGILTLLLSALMGHLLARRDPLEAGWRVGVPMMLIGVLSVLAVALPGLERLWIDPVVPIMALGGTFVLVTQFTHTQERSERDRNRLLLQRFVAPQVVEELLDDFENLGLGGTRQQVCVLFADVRNFTSFAESNTPEEVIEVINEYMTRMRQAMFRGNDKGWVLDKYTGDGLMAFYRVTGDEAGSVVQAVRGAMAMSQAAQEVSARRIQAGKQALGIGIGLHYGPAIVGLVGDPEQFNYTALGLTVVVSARLQSIAMGGEVIVSAEVYRLTSDVFRAEAGEPVSVKGLSEPVQPYRLLGELRPGIQPPPAFDLTAPTVQSNRVG